jgi:hypothetical protein
MIYKLEQYVDEDGRQVIHQIPIEKGKRVVQKKSEMNYFGTFQAPHPMGGGAQVQFNYPDGYSLEKCFQKFDELAKAEYEKLLQEFEEEKMRQMLSLNKDILTPDNAGGGIVTP